MVDLFANSFPIAFSFLHPAALAWTTVAAVPILIHLWSRRRQQTADWPYLRRLAAAVKAKRRRIWFANRGVLLLRIAAICLIVLAAAEPTGSAVLFSATSQATHHILVLDGSYSMRTLPGEDGDTTSTRLDRAIETARRIVTGAPGGDSFSVVLMTRPARLLTPRPVADMASVLSLLEDLNPPDRDFELPATLRLVNKSAAASEQGTVQTDRQVVYFLTDLQRHGWTDLDTSGNDDAEKTLRTIAGQASILAVDVAPTTEPNTAIAAMELGTQVPVPGRRITVFGTFRFFPGSSKENATKRETSVELYCDGRLVGNRAVTFHGTGEAQAEFPLIFEDAGEHVLEMRLPDDRLPLDNRRFLVVDVPRAIRALVVRPRETRPDYLHLALAAEDTTAPGIRVFSASEEKLAGTRLDTFDAVFLDGVQTITADARKTLDDYAHRGGRLILFPPADGDINQYHESLGDLLPANLAGRATLSDPQTLRPVDETSPLLRPFSAKGAAALLTTPVFACYRVEPNKEREDTDTILAAGDAPILLARRTGRGNVLLATVPLDPAWTGLPLWPSFVPLVREMVTTGAAQRAVSGNVPVGEPLSGIAPDLGSLRVLEIERPDGTRVRLPFEPTSSGSSWSFSDTEQAGLYRVYSTLLGAADTDPRLLARRAVNVATAESDLAQADTAVLRNRFPEVEFTVVPADSQQAETPPLLASTPRSSWPMWLLLSALTVLLIETWTATVPPAEKPPRSLESRETWHR